MNLALTVENFYTICTRLKVIPDHALPADPIKIWIGFSGGVDSRVLLELCYLTLLDFVSSRNFAPKIKLIAVHINHQLHPQADLWQNFCATTCQQLGIEFYAQAIDPKKISLKVKDRDGGGLEAKLRTARIAIWKQLLKPGEILLLGHHLNDQVETLFLRLVRGAGIKGLAAIREACTDQHLTIIRPLLQFSKQAILAFAKQYKLEYVEDHSNYDQKFTRNFLRHTVLPKLSMRWPGVLFNLARTIDHLQQADLYLTNQAIVALNNCYVWQIASNNDLCPWLAKNILKIKNFLTYPEFLQQEMLRVWIMQQRFFPPSSVQLAKIYLEVLEARIDRQPCLNTAQYSIMRYRDYLYLYPTSYKKNLTARLEYQWILGDLAIYFNHKKAQAKKIFQRSGIPPWLRPNYPLVFKNNKLIAILGLWHKDL